MMNGLNIRKNWFSSIGLTSDCLGEEVHPQNKLAHYAKACTDITFKFPFGEHELEGIAARGVILIFLSIRVIQVRILNILMRQKRKEKYLPHVIEPSLGVDRTFLAVLCSAYTIDEVEGENDVLLRFHPRVAPIKVGIFPLVKNKPALVERAHEIYKTMQRRWNVIYDQSGAIGRRYRRIDEVGVPFGITVDFDTIEGDGSVTVRNRDTTEQSRLSVDEAIIMIESAVNP